MTTTIDRPAAPRSASTAGRGGRARAASLFLTPFFVLFTAVTLIPIGYAIWLSLFTERNSGLGFGGTETVFTGLGNYRRALGDPQFRSGFVHVALYTAFLVPLMLAVSLAVALLLDSAVARAKRFFQLTLYLPHVVPGILAALVWGYLYTPGVSPVVSAMRSGGIGFDFLSPTGVLPAIVNIGIWMSLGYNVVVFYAALQAIPRELLESASLDGAGAARVAWSVKLPLIRSSIGLIGLFAGVGTLQLFAEPMLLNKVSHGAISNTWTPNMYVWAAAFLRNDAGLAAAGSILLALLAGLLSYAVTRIGKPWRNL
ncbi:carbohydrate ABC transporter permease [Streptomyces sp. DT224]|uniref:carbohydrate ABC transporter permease n=1 Tax=Streptomyces sp. DT224 TaxID=3393426 RepID=UPI003CFB2EAA